MIIRKSKAEIQKMRAAGHIVAQVLDRLSSLVAPGITTRDLDREAERMIRDAGALPTFKGYHGYPASICASVNDEVVHGIPGDKRLREGDIIGIDCGATFQGYVGDSAVTVPVGEVSDEVKRLMEITRQSLYQAISQCRVGNRLGDVCNAVQAYVEPLGYGIVRNYCGHGIGRAMHEEPQVPNYGKAGTGPALREGWVIAIEPMINLGHQDVKVLPDGWTVVTRDGRPSAHFEHTVAITEEGPQILTSLDPLPIDRSAVTG
ncbi:MAG TPA: type I methionyl aminopeptidase [Blastocatellia bacterium]|jgi:methionyl aminopeptidase|nr:type I methionyl aminopeptidase [Blastocatellia bacterium]